MGINQFTMPTIISMFPPGKAAHKCSRYRSVRAAAGSRQDSGAKAGFDPVLDLSHWDLLTLHLLALKVSLQNLELTRRSRLEWWQSLSPGKQMEELVTLGKIRRWSLDLSLLQTKQQAREPNWTYCNAKWPRSHSNAVLTTQLKH